MPGRFGHLLLRVRAVGAEDRVLVEQHDALHLPPGLRTDVAEEVEHRLGEHDVVRRCPEEPLQPALVQTRRRIVGRQVRHLVAVGDLRDGRRGGALIRTDQRRDMVLGDQPLGLGARLLRIALMIGKDQPQLRPAQLVQPAALAEQHRNVVPAVDDLGCGLHRRLRIGADLCVRPGHRVERADHHLVRRARRTNPDRQHECRDRVCQTMHEGPLGLPATEIGQTKAVKQRQKTRRPPLFPICPMHGSGKRIGAGATRRYPRQPPARVDRVLSVSGLHDGRLRWRADLCRG